VLQENSTDEESD